MVILAESTAIRATQNADALRFSASWRLCVSAPGKSPYCVISPSAANDALGTRTPESNNASANAPGST